MTAPEPGASPTRKHSGVRGQHVAFIVNMAGARACPEEGWAQGHHCFKDMVQEPRACLIQERGWWDVGRFSQLELQRCVEAGSHTHRSPCGTGQEVRQHLARRLSWAWAAQMHTDASGSCLKLSRAESWEGERPLVKTRSPHGSHTSSFLLTSTRWLRHPGLSLPSSYVSPGSSNCLHVKG